MLHRGASAADWQAALSFLNTNVLFLLAHLPMAEAAGEGHRGTDEERRIGRVRSETNGFDATDLSSQHYRRVAQ